MDSNYNGITMLSSSWARHGRLYNAAIKAVRDVSASTSIKPKIALHVADPKNADWFYNNIISNGVTDFDIMGFTYYYAYHYGSPNTVGNVIKTLLQIHPTYEAMVVETGYLWDTENIDGLGNIITTPSPDYLPVNPANQKKFMVDLTNAVMNAGGSGVIFWEPDWVSTPCRTPWGVGSSQEHVAFFDHRNNLNYMKNGAGGWPDAIINGEQLSEVKITFKVDMTGINVNNGVYITGSFTGSSNWSILPMNNEGNNIYSYTVEMLPSDVGAFYFLNNNDWDARETVPVECALMWNIDRKYIIGENDTVIAVKWGTCESFTTTVSKLSFSNGIKIYPNPNSGQQIIIENINKEPLTEIEFLNSLGQKEGIVYSYINNKSQITIYFKQIKKGFYFIKIKGNESVYSQKIIIN
jgi:arabinogalactan endo-1,4-beta-galactosidase